MTLTWCSVHALKNKDLLKTPEYSKHVVGRSLWKKKIFRVDFIYSHVPASTWALSRHHQLPSAAKTMDVELN